MIGWCKLCGGVLLVLVGTAGGWCAWLQKWERWQRLNQFGRLLSYLLDAIRYRALPGAVLLAMAAGRPEFASLRLEGCRSFSEIPLPPDLKEAFGADWAASLAEIEAAPQQTACRTLAYLVAECRKAEQEAARNAAQVRRLCLPLGGSLGLMAAILLV